MDTELIPSSGIGTSDVELYGHSPGLLRFPLGSATVLVYNPHDGSRQLLATGEEKVLQMCRDFSTLPAHAARCLRAGNLDEASIASSLQRLVEARLLVARADLAARCLAHKADSPPAQIASLCVPTRNRPEMLHRCVDSYARCARDFSRHVDFVVVDSSDDASVRRRNVDALSALQKRYAVAIHYLGPDERRDLADRLAHRGIDPVHVDFAMLNPEGFPCDTGANRNALLLATVDECTVQVDDDTLCRVAPWMATSKGVRFTSRFNPTEYAFFDEDESIPAGRFEQRDFFALHETLLGRSPGELIETHGLEALGFERPTGKFFRRMERGSARVSLTALGVAGDSGMSASGYFLQLDGESRSSLLRSERVYRAALARHRLIRAVAHLTVSEDAYCMTLNLGIDNCRLMPPFMPVQRSEDAIFGALVRATADGSCFGFVPWALAHEPLPRQRQDIATPGAGLSVSQIVHSIVRAYHPTDAKRPEANLFTLGQWLCDIGRGPAADFEEIARIHAWQQASQHVATMESLLQRHRGEPQFWAADVVRSIAALKASIAERYVAPLDLEHTFGADHAWKRLQRLVLNLGELLVVWPDVRKAAKQERVSGNPIGRRI